MASRARWNGFTGRIWPAGRSLETPGLMNRAVFLLVFCFSCFDLKNKSVYWTTVFSVYMEIAFALSDEKGTLDVYVS